jgi:hypothetical protein
MVSDREPLDQLPLLAAACAAQSELNTGELGPLFVAELSGTDVG